MGKTWLVRRLAELEQLKLVEINLERKPELSSFFTSNDPKQIMLTLTAHLGHDIDIPNTLLFLDEIQAFPKLLAKLRWFAEEMPELAIITAGSLLEFTLAKHSFSMPVGRIQYHHLEPLSFEEFLIANDMKTLADYLQQYEITQTIPAALHVQLMQYYKEFLLIGGMPAAVYQWKNEHSLANVNKIHENLLATYRDDFTKYNKNLDVKRLDETMLAVPKMLTEKFVYQRVNPDVRVELIKQALTLLNKARICHRVECTAANGVPLGAEVRSKYFKQIFLDVGLCNAVLGLDLNQVLHANDVSLINKGAVAEQAVGQALRGQFPEYVEPKLYYWQRTETGANAEVDYIIQDRNRVIPIEVKAGSTGALKSLHVFMDMKKLELAVRINADEVSLTEIAVKTHSGQAIQYKLLSLPSYLTGQLKRILKTL